MTSQKFEDSHDPIEESFWFWLIVVFGLGLRLLVPMLAEFPLNDGGLFYTMILDLEANGFSIPATTTYNLSQIPFAYPPLGFYLGAIIHTLSKFDLLDILRITPPLIACLCLVPAWNIIKILIPSPLGRLIGFLAYSLNYATYEWAIMGGGITRAPGMFFALMAIWYFLQLQRVSSATRLLLCGVFSACTALSHPQCTYFLGASLLVLWASGVSRPSFRQIGCIILSALMILAPWIIALSQHGNELAFLQAIQTSSSRGNSIYRPFALLAESPVSPMILAAGLLVGAMVAVFSGQVFLIVWFLLLFLVPRLASFYTMLPAALLFGVGLSTALLTLCASAGQSFVLRSFRGRTVLVFIFASFVGISWARTAFLDATIFTKEEFQGLQREAARSAPGAVFLSLSRPDKPDHFITEWLPALTKRKCLLTPEGKEWQDAKDFTSTVLAWNDVYSFMQDPLRKRTKRIDDWLAASDVVVLRAEDFVPELLPGWKEQVRLGSIALFREQSSITPASQ